MPECSNILYRLSQSCPHCNAAYRYCLFLNFTSHFLFSEDKWRSNILCLKVVLIYIYNLALSHHPCSFLKTPLVTYYEDLPYWQRYYVLPFFDSHNRNTCWLSLRKSQFGRIFVHFVRSFTGENKGHPFPVQVHVLLEEEAEDHLHQIGTSAIIVSENHWLMCFQMSHPVNIGSMLFQECPDSAESNRASRALEITKIFIFK